MTTPTDSPLAAVQNAARELVATIVSLTIFLGTVVVCVGWMAFWMALVRLHYVDGDLFQAAVVLVTMVVPGLGALLWYVNSKVDAVDLSSLAPLRRGGVDE